MYDFATQAAERSKSLHGMMKGTGLFKSKGHHWVVLNKVFEEYDMSVRKDHIDCTKMFGTHSTEGEVIITIEGTVQHGDYGTRGIKRWMKMAIVDGFGIKRVYKIGQTGNARDGMGCNPLKTEVIWERSVSTDGLTNWSDESLKADKAYQDKKAEELALLADVPNEGRICVRGKILSSKVKDTPYGYVTKLVLMSNEGYKVYGSAPSKIEADCSVGAEISFMAKVEPSDQDSKFGFWSRPTKPLLMNPAKEESV